MVAQALDLLTPTLRTVAGWLDTSYASLQSYRLERRTAPAALLRRLAVLCRRQAGKLDELAKRLDAEAERDV